MCAKRLCCAVGFAAGLVLFAAPAAADYPANAPVRPFNLPDLSGLTAVGLDLQVTWWTIPLAAPNTEIDYTNTTIDLHADIEIAPHWVIVARMPFAYTDLKQKPDDNVDCCGFGLGNLTLGVRGLFSSLEGQGWRSVLGFDFLLSLATASDEGDDAVSASWAAFARQTHDPGRYLPNTWTPRLSGHGQFYSSWFMLQVEGGLHLFLYDDDVPGDDSDIAVRLAMAAGVRATAELAILLELNSMVFVSEDEADDETVTSLDLGVRYGGRGFAAGLRVFVPLDQSLRDLDMLGIGADVSARF
jgi:hypothetical protein